MRSDWTHFFYVLLLLLKKVYNYTINIETVFA